MVEDERLIVFCGLDCSKCPAYIATKENDAARLAELSEKWSNYSFGIFTPQDLVCDGCHGPRLFKWCCECAIRDCCFDRGFKTCAECEEYPCDRLSELWEKFGEAGAASKANLDGLRG